MAIIDQLNEGTWNSTHARVYQFNLKFLEQTLI